MKARIKATGEIVNVQSGSLIAVLRDGDEAWNAEELEIEDVEILPDGYEEVRTRAAIAAMQGLLSNPEFVNTAYNEYNISIEKVAVGYADAIVEQLKKKIGYDTPHDA